MEVCPNRQGAWAKKGKSKRKGPPKGKSYYYGEDYDSYWGDDWYAGYFFATAL